LEGDIRKGETAKALPFLLRVRKELPEFSDVHYHLGSVYGRMGQKGLSHFYFGKYFKLRGEGAMPSAISERLLICSKRKSGKGGAQREIKEMTPPTK
jgi:hypothetical protein